MKNRWYKNVDPVNTGYCLWVYSDVYPSLYLWEFSDAPACREGQTNQIKISFAEAQFIAKQRRINIPLLYIEPISLTEEQLL